MATAFIPAHLWRHERLFTADLYAPYFYDFDTEFIIIDTRGIVDAEKFRREHEYLRERGYRLWDAGILIEVFRQVAAIEAEEAGEIERFRER